MFAFRTLISPAAVVPVGRLRLPAGDDGGGGEGVRLRADWPAVLAMTGYAGRAVWLFGNRGAALECVEKRPRRRCSLHCGSGDRTTVRLDFGGWVSAVARREGAVRVLEFFSSYGRTIACVRLEDIRPALDEMIWLLADDAPVVCDRKLPRGSWRGDTVRMRQVLPLLERREDFDRVTASYAVPRCDAFVLAGAHVATAIETDAVGRALLAATEAGIRLCVRLENAGGSVCWTPTVQSALGGSDFLELRSQYGRLHVDRRYGPTWVVHLSAAPGGGPSLEAQSLSDGGWIRIDAPEPAQRDAWRELCLLL